jgi:molybdate transport system ATP-binding protein
MSLSIEVRHALGRIDLDVAISTGGGLTALVGASGAGKTSVLNIVAGLLRPQYGVVRIDDEVVVDTTRGIWRPAHTRRVGYVFQEPRLFPHLTVRHNLLFGQWCGRSQLRRIAFDDVVDLLDLRMLLARRTPKLSGGEAQRVALGRALLTQPRLLLLDEPLASVDVARRAQVLPYLDRLRAELSLPTIYVTHTLSEIASRAERLITLHEGREVDAPSQQEAVSRDLRPPG